jgi:hypothetical protein
MSAAATTPLNVPEDAATVDDRVHALESRVRIMTPILSMWLEEKIQSETSSLKANETCYQRCKDQKEFLDLVLLPSTTFEIAVAKYKELESVYTKRGFPFATPHTAFSLKSNNKLDVLCSLLYCIGGHHGIDMNDTVALAERSKLINRDYENAKESLEMRRGHVAFLVAQHTALNAESAREKEARRKEAARRELEAQIAALQEKLKAL